MTLEISLSNGVTWTVNGQDIPENADLTDLDLGVTLDASTIPVSVVNTITGRWTPSSSPSSTMGNLGSR